LAAIDEGRDVVSPNAGASDVDQKEQNAPEGAKNSRLRAGRLFPKDACRIGQDAAFQKKRIPGYVSKQNAKLRSSGAVFMAFFGG
jgi:hypothetical protein